MNRQSTSPSITNHIRKAVIRLMKTTLLNAEDRQSVSHSGVNMGP